MKGLLPLFSFFSCRRYQHFSTMFSPHGSERQRERQRGLVKQTFELDEAAAAERQDEQVANGAVGSACILKAFSLKVYFYTQY